MLAADVMGDQPPTGDDDADALLISHGHPERWAAASRIPNASVTKRPCAPEQI